MYLYTIRNTQIHWLTVALPSSVTGWFSLVWPQNSFLLCFSPLNDALAQRRQQSFWILFTWSFFCAKKPSAQMRAVCTVMSGSVPMHWLHVCVNAVQPESSIRHITLVLSLPLTLRDFFKFLESLDDIMCMCCIWWDSQSLYNFTLRNIFLKLFNNLQTKFFF